MLRIIFHVMAGLLTLLPILYLEAVYKALPDQIPVHWGLSGADRFAAKSLVSVFFGPVLAMFLQAFLALLIVDMQRALDGATGEGKRRALRVTLQMMEPVRLLLAALLSLVAIQAPLHAARADTAWVGPVVITLAAAIAILAITGAIRASKWQGVWEDQEVAGSANSWKWGVIYSNRANPHFLVPKRLGFGFTFNFAHPRAKVYLLFLLASWAVIVAGVMLKP